MGHPSAAEADGCSDVCASVLVPRSASTTNKNSPALLEKAEVDSKIPADSRQPPAAIESSIDKWFYISGSASA